MVRESQGIRQKSLEKVGKSQGDFFGKFLSPMNQDPLFILAIVCQTSLTSFFSFYFSFYISQDDNRPHAEKQRFSFYN